MSEIMSISTKRIGRNDPCPCDSGKKYKHCCLGTIEATRDLWTRVSEAHRRVGEKVFTFAISEFGHDMETAWEDFYLGEPDGPLSPSSPDNAIFIPYFLFLWTGSWKNGRPTPGIVARTFLKEYVGPLDSLERQELESSLAEPVTFYEILSCRPGEGFSVRDVLTAREFSVKERSGSKAVRTGDIIYGQMSPMTGITTMAFCAPTIIPPARSLILS